MVRILIVLKTSMMVTGASSNQFIRGQKKTVRVANPKTGSTRVIRPAPTEQKPAVQPQVATSALTNIQPQQPTTLLGGQQVGGAMMSTGAEQHVDESQPTVMVKTKYGSRLMTMRDYDNYLLRLEEEDRQKEAQKEAELKAKRDEREKRRQQKREELAAQREKKKEFIVPQALFGVGPSNDPYMKDKVFPPHLYPHLYPDRFPELFPHIYGEQLKKQKDLEKATKERNRELILFRDPRASKIPPHRRLV